MLFTPIPSGYFFYEETFPTESSEKQDNSSTLIGNKMKNKPLTEYLKLAASIDPVGKDKTDEGYKRFANECLEKLEITPSFAWEIDTIYQVLVQRGLELEWKSFFQGALTNAYLKQEDE